MLVVCVVVMALMLTMAPVAFARVDQFGGGNLAAAPYAPYTAGPVVTTQVPYAPYTAGPVVHEQKAMPYAPYTAGPVVRDAASPARIGQFLKD